MLNPAPNPASSSLVFPQAFMDEFKVARQQTSMAKFEEKFKALTEKYPKADQYMGVIYEDRKRWAEYVSPLAFSVGSWTTSRVEGVFLRTCFVFRQTMRNLIAACSVVLGSRGEMLTFTQESCIGVVSCCK